MVDFGPRKEFTQHGNRPGDGWYALDDSTIRWIKCRDTFRIHFDESVSGIYFSHPANQGHQIANFISHTENILQAEHSIFRKTNRNYALWMEPSWFWATCPMRRSFLTILLRCGLNYRTHSHNYDDALFGHPYIQATRAATMRFLFGFTEYQQDARRIGWKRAFEKAPDEEVKTSLVWPRNKSREPCLVGVGSLWQ